MKEQVEQLNQKIQGLTEENSNLHNQCSEMEELEAEKSRATCQLAQI